MREERWGKRHRNYKEAFMVLQTWANESQIRKENEENDPETSSRAGSNWAVYANSAQHLQSFHPGTERKGSDLTGDGKLDCSVTCSPCHSGQRRIDVWTL